MAEALELLLKHNLSGVPVIDDDRNLIGVISKSDIFTGTSKKWLKKGRGNHD